MPRKRRRREPHSLTGPLNLGALKRVSAKPNGPGSAFSARRRTESTPSTENVETDPFRDAETRFSRRLRRVAKRQ